MALKDKITPEDLKECYDSCYQFKKTFAASNAVNLLTNKYHLKPYSFKQLNRIGDLHFSMKTDNAVILMPSDLMPATCRIVKLDFDEQFKLEYGWYYKEMNDDVKWVIENL